MSVLSRGLPAVLLVGAIAVLAVDPVALRAQAKKDAKKDVPVPKKEAPVAKKDVKKDAKPDETGEKLVGFGTSDGLTLNGYWFQGVGLEKQRPDAVMMFPAPGTKITDAWIDLAKKLSEKNFSVLLFDWRGCGMNGPDAGSRIFENSERFWAEPYNMTVLKGRKGKIDDKGLDYRTDLVGSVRNMVYRDFMLNDLMGARFFLDKMNDNQKCNTNRVWVVSEKDGAHLGLAFIATEFRRNTVYNPKSAPLDVGQFRSAGKDYAGLVALSYAGSNPTANVIYRNAFPSSSDMGVKEARSHLENRLATVLIYSKKEGQSASKGLVNLLGSGGSEDHMKRNFKYLREVDTKDKAVSGIAMIDPMNTFGTKDMVQTAMLEISKRQNYGKDATDREANKMTTVPRFAVELYSRR